MQSYQKLILSHSHSTQASALATVYTYMKAWLTILCLQHLQACGCGWQRLRPADCTAVVVLPPAGSCLSMGPRLTASCVHHGAGSCEGLPYSCHCCWCGPVLCALLQIGCWSCGLCNFDQVHCVSLLLGCLPVVYALSHRTTRRSRFLVQNRLTMPPSTAPLLSKPAHQQNTPLQTLSLHPRSYVVLVVVMQADAPATRTPTAQEQEEEEDYKLFMEIQACTVASRQAIQRLMAELEASRSSAGHSRAVSHPVSHCLTGPP